MYTRNLSSVVFYSLVGISIFLISCIDTEEPFDVAKQFETDQGIIDDYIQRNDLLASVQEDSLGYELRYVMNVSGTGESPLANDWLFLDYTGKLLPSETVFESRDSVYFRFTNNLISGWQILIPYMREGGDMTMMLPSAFAYGQFGTSNGTIPPNTPIVFDVRLRGVYDQFGYEQKLIEDYLIVNDLEAVKDTSESLYYIIHEPGDTNYPVVTDSVDVAYKGYFLLDDEVFDESDSRVFYLNGLIRGWQILLPYIGVGGRMTIYLPSEFGYGSQGRGPVPANTPIAFDITLNEVN